MTRTPFAAQHVQTGLLTPLDKLPMTPVPAGTLIPFTWVDPERIPARHRKFVTRHVDRLALELGVPRVLVQFFGPTRSGMPDFFHRATHDDFLLGGIASRLIVHEMQTVDGQPLGTPGETPIIAILAGLRGAALVNVLAHEMKHVAQQTTDLPREEHEADAERFAADYMRRVA